MSLEELVQRLSETDSPSSEDVNALLEASISPVSDGILDTCLGESSRQQLDCLFRNMTSFLFLSKPCHKKVACADFVNLVVLKMSREQRESLLKKYFDMFNNISELLSSAGDYGLQLVLLDILTRISKASRSQDLKTKLFNGSKSLNQKFSAIQRKSFEIDARKFLNDFNCGLGHKARVFSIPCISAKLGDQSVVKPTHDSSEFWIDFNLLSRCIAFNCQKENSDRQCSQMIIIKSSNVGFCQLRLQSPDLMVMRLTFLYELNQLSQDDQNSHYSSAQIVFKENSLLANYVKKIFPNATIEGQSHFRYLEEIRITGIAKKNIFSNSPTEDVTNDSFDNNIDLNNFRALAVKNILRGSKIQKTPSGNNSPVVSIKENNQSLRSPQISASSVGSEQSLKDGQSMGLNGISQGSFPTSSDDFEVAKSGAKEEQPKTKSSCKKLPSESIKVPESPKEIPVSQKKTRKRGCSVKKDGPPKKVPKESNNTRKPRKQEENKDSEALKVKIDKRGKNKNSTSLLNSQDSVCSEDWMEILAKNKKSIGQGKSCNKSPKNALLTQKAISGRGKPARARNPPERVNSSPVASIKKGKVLNRRSSLKEPVVMEPSPSPRVLLRKHASCEKIVRFTEPAANSPSPSLFLTENTNCSPNLAQILPTEETQVSEILDDSLGNEIKQIQSLHRTYGFKKALGLSEQLIEIPKSQKAFNEKLSETNSFEDTNSSKSGAYQHSSEAPARMLSYSNTSTADSSKENKLPLRRADNKRKHRKPKDVLKKNRAPLAELGIFDLCDVDEDSDVEDFLSFKKRKTLKVSLVQCKQVIVSSPEDVTSNQQANSNFQSPEAPTLQDQEALPLEILPRASTPIDKDSLVHDASGHLLDFSPMEKVGTKSGDIDMDDKHKMDQLEKCNPKMNNPKLEEMINKKCEVRLKNVARRDQTDQAAHDLGAVKVKETESLNNWTEYGRGEQSSPKSTPHAVHNDGDNYSSSQSSRLTIERRMHAAALETIKTLIGKQNAIVIGHITQTLEGYLNSLATPIQTILAMEENFYKKLDEELQKE